jgi:uncharacterized metal-binding protein YceD (DUF177 family)
MYPNSAAHAVDGTIKLNKLQADKEEIVEMNDTNPWIKSILDELESGLDDDDLTKIKIPGTFKLNLLISKRHSDEYKDHVVIEGKITGGHNTPCIKCLVPTYISLDHEFDACFFHPSFENNPDYTETTHIYVKDRDFELYFFDEKGEINLKELIHENGLLATEPLPIHKEDCLGLCAHCGIDLNFEKCKKRNHPECPQKIALVKPEGLA